MKTPSTKTLSKIRHWTVAWAVPTCAMIAVPLRFSDAIHGGVSCVRLKHLDTAAPEPPPFSPGDLAVVTDAVREVERLVQRA